MRAVIISLLGGAVGQVREVDAFELSLNEPLVFGPEQGQIVKTGFGRWWGRQRVWLEVGMSGIDQVIGLSQLEKGLVAPEFEVRQSLS